MGLMNNSNNRQSKQSEMSLHTSLIDEKADEQYNGRDVGVILDHLKAFSLSYDKLL